MPIPLAAMAVGAATPFIANALSKLFGGDAEAAEKAALERARQQYQRIAEGGTTQGQAGLSYARARALQELAGQAQRGTAQQRAGLEREAMRTGADVQARYASQLAELRAMEQERARQGVANVEARESLRAGQEAQRQRQMIAGAITGAATPLVTSLLTPDTSRLTPEEIASYNEQQALTRPSPTTMDQGAAFSARMSEIESQRSVPLTQATQLQMDQAPAAAPTLAGPTLATPLQIRQPGLPSPGQLSLASPQSGPSVAQPTEVSVDNLSRRAQRVRGLRGSF